MIRILHIVGSLERAGIESFLMNIYRNIDTTKVQFDFLIYNNPSNNSYFNEVRERGGKVFIVPSKSEGIIKNYLAIKKVIYENQYNVVWRSCSSCISGMDLLAAKKAGSNIRILHSHSSSRFGFEKLLHYVLRPLCNTLPTHRLACGERAGRWMFGANSFEVVPNGISTGNYRYDEITRDRYRKEYNLEGKTVIAHIGRFDKVKNQAFLIDIFREYHKANSDSKLVFIGSGKMQEDCRRKAAEYGLNESVEFLGVRNDIPDIMQMVDVFVMPSLYEGFPVSLLEVQAAGVPAVVSDGISKETNLYGNVRFVNLEEGVEKWIEAINSSVGKRDVLGYKKLYDLGFDIDKVVKQVEVIIGSREKEI